MRPISNALIRFALMGAMALAIPAAAVAGSLDHPPTGTPEATLDLGTTDGVAAIGGPWRYHDVRVFEADFRSVGADLKPSGSPNRTYDYEPKPETSAFEDGSWETVDPATLAARRSTGKVCFAWYRLDVTVPDRVGALDTRGTTVVLEVVVDDYAEVWVDGKLERELGQRGGSVVAGWNAPNRVTIGRDLRPGQTIRVAIFAMNGPVSAAPENYIWIRSARLQFYRPLEGAPPLASEPANLLRIDPSIDSLIRPGTTVDKLADGFQFTEGPVWSPDGALLFSDPNTNTMYRYTRDGRIEPYRRPSGYDGADVGRLNQPGSNGLAFDSSGRLTVCEHGNRRITRIEPDGKVTVLADRFEGKRLNSPNDLVYRSDGALYFTDPPFGLPKFHDDPDRELPFTGVFCLRNGTLKVVARELTGPNGIAFSPDERYLYVSNWDVKRKVILRYDVKPDGSLGKSRVFFDMTGAPGDEALDGLKVDERGNVYSSGPGGVWIISPAGKHLATLRAPELPANMAWGDDDRRTLYMTARTGLYRIRLQVGGAHKQTVIGMGTGR